MIIFRYVCKDVIATLLATTLILLIIFIINQFVHYLNDAADGKITLQAVTAIMSLQVPMLLGYLLPLSLFLGLLLTLGRMYAEHELVVLSACGMSRLQLGIIVMSLSLFVSLIVAWLMLSVEPKMQWYRAKILLDAVTNASLEKIMPERFQPLGDDKVFYAASVGEHHKKMNDVFLSQKLRTSSGGVQWDIVAADEAHERNTAAEGRFIVFKDGFRYMGVPGELKFNTMKFGEYGARLVLPSTSIDERIEALSTKKLWLLRKSNNKAAAELQWRIAMPLSTWVFALLAIPLSYSAPRKGKFAQMLPALLIYVVYANLMFVGRAWIEKGVVSNTIGLWWIHGLLLILALILLTTQSSGRGVLTLFKIFTRKGDDSAQSIHS